MHLSARMADGTNLPNWLVFDPATGKFTGEIPPGSPDEMVLIVEARDRDGRRAEAMFKIKLAAGTPAGRAALSEQIRMAQQGGDSLDGLRQLQRGSRGTPAARP